MARLTMFWHLRWWSSFLVETGSAGRDVIMEFDDQGRESAASISLQNVIWSIGVGMVERGREAGWDFMVARASVVGADLPVNVIT